MTEDRTIEAKGTDTEAAIAAGLQELGLDRSDVEVEVLDEGSRGVFGLGAREACVRLMVKPHPAAAPAGPALQPAAPEAAERDEAEIAQKVLLELLAMMDLEQVRVDTRRAEAAPGEEETPLVAEVRGAGTDILIGRQGRTLAALQHITRLIVSQETGRRPNLIVDVESFKARREKSLQGLAQRMAEQATRAGRTVVLEPMPPHERRIIHLTLRDHPHVTTESVGDGERRKVTIIPRD